MKLELVEGPVLEQVLDATGPSADDGLNRHARGRLHAALTKTPWGASSHRFVALVDGPEVLAGAQRHHLAAVVDGRAVRVCGIGAVSTAPGAGGSGRARLLVDLMLQQAVRDGAEMALIFSHPGADDYVPEEFSSIPLTDLTLDVAQSPRHGAPMTMVRAGEERDLAAVVAMGRVRADAFRLHLDRDADYVQHAITRLRLLAGLGPAHARQLHYFIAEEGITAAAYVIVSVAGTSWTLEECGDRDPSGARVGALLQALIAREPVERRPTIRAWLPPHFRPPQITIASSVPSSLMMRVLMLGPDPIAPDLLPDDVLYWRSDVF